MIAKMTIKVPVRGRAMIRMTYLPMSCWIFRYETAETGLTMTLRYRKGSRRMSALIILKETPRKNLSRVFPYPRKGREENPAGLSAEKKNEEPTVK